MYHGSKLAIRTICAECENLLLIYMNNETLKSTRREQGESHDRDHPPLDRR